MNTGDMNFPSKIDPSLNQGGERITPKIGRRGKVAAEDDTEKIGPEILKSSAQKSSPRMSKNHQAEIHAKAVKLLSKAEEIKDKVSELEGEIQRLENFYEVQSKIGSTLNEINQESKLILPKEINELEKQLQIVITQLKEREDSEKTVSALINKKTPLAETDVQKNSLQTYRDNLGEIRSDIGRGKKAKNLLEKLLTTKQIALKFLKETPVETPQDQEHNDAISPLKKEYIKAKEEITSQLKALDKEWIENQLQIDKLKSTLSNTESKTDKVRKSIKLP